MKKEKPIHLHYWYLIPAIIAICLIIVAFSLVIIYSDTEKNSNIIQNAISLSTLIVTGLTLVFLYLTLKQQQGQIDSNKDDVEFNRVLDLVYRQMEISREKTNFPNNISNAMQSITDNSETLLNYISEIDWLYAGMLKMINDNLNILDNEIIIYRNIIDESTLSEIKKYKLYFLTQNNLLSKYLQFYHSIQSVIANHPEKFEFKEPRKTRDYLISYTSFMSEMERLKTINN